MAKRKTKDRIPQGNAFGSPRKKAAKPADSANLVSVPKNSRRGKKRVGRGPGSGMGTRATRGQKGQRARASSMAVGFEGGQLPIYKRMPKRGFKNIFHKEYQAVNLTDIAKANLAGTISVEILKEKGLVRESDGLIKILGTGDLKSAVTITADACSKSALEKIQKAGGSFVQRAVQAPKMERA
jgi:large subunit ribosomal protein L15